MNHSPHIIPSSNRRAAAVLLATARDYKPRDYEPSLDHYGFMRTRLDYMLMSTLDDAKGSVLLFPAFLAQQWNVQFMMHALRNTVIEASCQEGKLEYLTMTPPERKADITVMNCKAE